MREIPDWFNPMKGSIDERRTGPIEKGRWRTTNPEDVVRGGVVVDTGNEGIENGADVDIQVEEDNLESSGEMTYLDVGNAEYIEEQIIDLMDRDLGDNQEMEEATNDLTNNCQDDIDFNRHWNHSVQ